MAPSLVLINSKCNCTQNREITIAYLGQMVAGHTRSTNTVGVSHWKKSFFETESGFHSGCKGECPSNSLSTVIAIFFHIHVVHAHVCGKEWTWKTFLHTCRYFSAVLFIFEFILWEPFSFFFFAFGRGPCIICFKYCSFDIFFTLHAFQGNIELIGYRHLISWRRNRLSMECDTSLTEKMPSTNLPGLSSWSARWDTKTKKENFLKWWQKRHILSILLGL